METALTNICGVLEICSALNRGIERTPVPTLLGIACIGFVRLGTESIGG